MMRIYQSVADLAGNTPLLELCRYEQKHALQARVLAKLECCNIAGSAKDRVAKRMIECAERDGKLTEGSVIIEPTSGNTGIGLAAMAKAHGYRVILTMPDTMSKERCDLLRAYGAELALTPGAQGMAGAIKKAEELARENPGSFIPSQFDNPANPEAHYLTTGPEIWADTDGKVNVFVAGVGSGGTISGTGRFLKEKKPDVQIVAVEPASSPLISRGIAGAHGLQGIGANFVPKNYDAGVVDEVICVSDEEAYTAGREMVALEGVLVGITAGAALHAATVLAQRPENKGKTIVALLPDGGDKYLSTPMYQEK